MRVDFYQLTRDPAEKVVPLLAARIMATHGRALIVSKEQAQLSSLSSALWEGPPTSFLAHGLVGDEPGDCAAQPILLSTEMTAENDARNLIVADGLWRDPADGCERLFFLFPPTEVEAARVAWRALADAGEVARHYWRQDGGKWIEQA